MITHEFETTVEHGQLMSGGGFHVRNPEEEAVYPLALWIKHGQRHGGKIYTRKIIVLEDWEEVQP